MITCEQCRERLNDLLDETSLSPSDSALRDLRSHVAGCAPCTHDLTLLRAAQSELRAMPEVPAPAALRSRVLSALEAEKAPAKRGLGAAFAAFLQRPTRVAWAGGALATACFLMILAQAPEIQNSNTQLNETKSRSAEFAAPSPEKQERPEGEAIRSSAGAAAKKPPGNSAPAAPKIAAARRDNSSAAPIAPSPTPTPLSAPKDLPKAKSVTTRTHNKAAKVIAKSAASTPALTRRVDDANSLARGPLMPENAPSISDSEPRAAGQPSKPDFQPRNLPSSLEAPKRTRHVEGIQPGALGMRGANGPETNAPVSPNVPSPSPRVPFNNRMAKMNRAENGAFAENIAPPSAAVKIAPQDGAASSLAMPRVKNSGNSAESSATLSAPLSASADNMQVGAAGAAGAAGATARPQTSPKPAPHGLAQPNTALNNDSVASTNGTESANARGGSQSGPASSYMMRTSPALPGEATDSGGGFGARGAKGDAPAMAAKLADERKDDEKPKERRVLPLNTARDVTFSFSPARDWSAAQVRLVLPSSIRFADAKKSSVLWRGAARRGQNISVTASLLAREVGTWQIRLILEQSAGGTALPVQTQIVAVDAVR